jgi:hypothetical protein
VSAAPSFTCYTYSPTFQSAGSRWRDDVVRNPFFGSAESARQALVDLREAVSNEPDHDLPPMHLERVVTVPVTKEVMVALLNSGVGAIVKKYDIIETIGEN